MVLFGPDGEREVPADQFFLAPGKTARKVDEFMTAVRFPAPPPGNRGRYLKLGRNKAGDLAIVGVAVLAFPSADTPSGYAFRLALASVAPVPLRVQLAEQLLADTKPGKAAFTAAATAAMEVATPIDDVRSSANYRKEMVRALTLRALEEVWRELETRNER